MTIIFTTHVLYEVNKLCDRVAIMKQGTIAGIGTIPELRKQVNADEGTDFEERLPPLPGGRLNGRHDVRWRRRSSLDIIGEKKFILIFATLLIVTLVSAYQGGLQLRESQSTTGTITIPSGQGGRSLR